MRQLWLSMLVVLASMPVQATFRANPERTGVYVDAGPVSLGVVRQLTISTSALVGTPVVVGDVVYVGDASGILYAYDTKSESLLWSAFLNGGVATSPWYDGATVYAGSTSGFLGAFDAGKGTLVWSTMVPGGVVSSPLVAGATVYCSGNDGVLYALDSAAGKEIWRYQTAAPLVSSPATDLTHIYVAGTDGYLYALNFDGSLAWRAALDAGATATPAVDAGVVYIADSAASFYGFDAVTGARLWTQGSPFSDQTSTTIWGTSIALGTFGGHCEAASNTDGSWLWRFVSGRQSSPKIVAGTATLFFSDGDIVALKRSDGSWLWKAGLTNQVFTEPVVEGTRLFAAGQLGQLIIIEDGP